MHTPGIRADDGQRLHFGAVERENPAFVLEQHDRFPGRVESQRLVCWCVGRALSPLGIDKWPLEEPGEELRPQYSRDRAIDCRFGDAAALDERDELGKAVRIRQFEIDARFERLAAGVGFVRRHVMASPELLDAEVVGSDETIESPLAAQDVLEQPAVRMRRYTVDVVVADRKSV